MVAHEVTITDVTFSLLATPQAAEEPVIVPGLRIMKPANADHEDKTAPAAAAAAVAASAPKTAVVGDGGLSWRMKALARAKAQASEGGVDLSQVVAERWGSLGSLTSALTEGRAADGGRGR